MYPDKLIFWFPEYAVKDYRLVLSGIDDAFVVHRRRDNFIFDLRTRAVLIGGRHGRQLLSLAADLQANYTVSIIDRDAVLEELVERATATATTKTREPIEAAALIVAERTRYQVVEFLDSEDAEKQAVRYVLSRRARKTDVDPARPNGLNWQNGIATPRSEQMWHVTANEHLDPRDYQRALTAWSQWAKRNRPPMPKLEV